MSKILKPKSGCRIYVGDCRSLLPRIRDVADRAVDLVFADPPFNCGRAYDQWDDSMPHDEYMEFTSRWIELCVGSLKQSGSMWINIPDEWAAEIVMLMKGHGMHMVNWCIWHYRFGQNTSSRFISSKTHSLYFCKDLGLRTWNPDAVLEPSDRASTYGDPRTMEKKDGHPGKRVPMDVWYGKNLGRVQGNNAERRHGHDNQLPEMYLSRVLRATSNKGNLVLDPFLGSGTSAVVATSLDRKFIGCEFSEKLAQSAAIRVRAGPVRDLTASVSSAIHPKRSGIVHGIDARPPQRRRESE